MEIVHVREEAHLRADAIADGFPELPPLRTRPGRDCVKRESESEVEREEECKTPTSEEHKIPEPSLCPPPPRKNRPPPKRKALLPQPAFLIVVPSDLSSIFVPRKKIKIRRAG
ncbi:hypothetical protein AMTRI_Chr13g121610 [Amborella trichopoda]